MAALLAVEPLDDVTRRRLVNTAIRSTGTARHARRLIGAAAAVVVLVVGAGVVVAVGSGNDSTTSSAARDKAASLLPQADGARGLTVESDARGVGDFGDLGVAANVDRLRRAFDAAGAVPTGDSARPEQSGTAGVGAERRGRADSNLSTTGELRRARGPPPRARLLALEPPAGHGRRGRIGDARRLSP